MAPIFSILTTRRPEIVGPKQASARALCASKVAAGAENAQVGVALANGARWAPDSRWGRARCANRAV